MAKEAAIRFQKTLDPIKGHESPARGAFEKIGSAHLQQRTKAKALPAAAVSWVTVCNVDAQNVDTQMATA